MNFPHFHLLQAAALSHAALAAASAAKLAAVGYCRDDIYLHAAPLFHVGGISSALAVLTVRFEICDLVPISSKTSGVMTHLPA